MNSNIPVGRLFLTIFTLFLLIAGTVNADAQEVLLIEIEGTITAGTTQFIQESLEEAEQGQYDALLLSLNTPGGLVDATLGIIQDILNSPVPVLTYVHPRGAIAASAGTFIMLSGHVAAMAPGTTIGAAMPVTMQPGSEGQQKAGEKTIKFLAGHMRNIAEERGRPAELAGRFVTENLTLGAEPAEERDIIDLQANDYTALLDQVDGRTVNVRGKEVRLSTAEAELSTQDMNFRQQVSSFISNPQVAFILLMLGVYGIFFGLNMPGTFIPEIIGALSLILALFGLGMFDINTLGIVLIVIAIILFVAEAFTPTFGIFTAFGAAALLTGALMLPVEPLLPGGWYREFIITVLGMVAVTVAFFILVITKLIASSRRPPAHADFGMKGFEGTVTEDLNPDGLIKIRGEWWRATSADGEVIPKESRVTVRDKDGMVLIVAKKENELTE
ncbi:MAG: NfeD family protein [Spirochaetota bacterium]